MLHQLSEIMEYLTIEARIMLYLVAALRLGTPLHIKHIKKLVQDRCGNKCLVQTMHNLFYSGYITLNEKYVYPSRAGYEWIMRLVDLLEIHGGAALLRAAEAEVQALRSL